MNDPQLNDEQLVYQRPSRGGRAGFFILFLALMLVAGAFGYGYFELYKVNLTLAQSVATLQKNAESDQAAFTALQQSVNQLRQGEEKAQALSTQQEQLMNDWRAAQKGDLDKWHLAEAQYLTKLANDNLQYTANTSLALTLLERADQSLSSLTTGNVMEIRKSLSADIAAIKSAPSVDTTAIYLRLNGLNTQLDKLVLPENPLTLDEKNKAEKISMDGLSWWKAAWLRSGQLLQQVVIVRNTGSNALPLVVPEEKTFLYQNLHAQMENAMWAVLHHNTSVYQASLDRATEWIKKYFSQDNAVTKNILEELAALRALNVETSASNISATLQLFEPAPATQAPTTP